MSAENTSPAPAPEHGPWRAEVTTSDYGGDRKWNSNGLRFPDKDAALDYARNLASRWTLVTRWRAVDESVPLHQAYEPGSEDGSW